MEEKRREVGSQSPAAAISGATSTKTGDSPASEPPPPRRRGQKRKSTATTSHSSSAPPKRHAREKAAAAAAAASGGVFSLMPPIHNGPLTRARQLSDNNAAIFSALNAVKNDHHSSKNDSAVSEGREEVSAAKEEYKKFMAEIDAEFDTIRCRDSNVHVVPVAAGWFSWTTIHSIEKQTMRSFFNGKVENRTPDIYQEIRNWIMKKFHANPSTNIELKDLAELSVGDLEARQEIMEFLDHWGLINYHPFLENDPANVDADPNTDGEKAEKTDSVIEKLFQFENEQSSPDLVPRANWSAAAVPSGLFPESIAEELVKQEGPAVEYHCNSCSADCSRKRYHCQKQADFDLCSDCYNNGKFGSGMCPSDFILMEPAEASGGTGGKWTDQETLLLLEALELYRENWNEIAEHVATKTKAQCILHFLQMPIEDNFLDDDDTKDGAPENKEPTSTNNESSVPKDNLEPLEGGTTKDKSGPAENGTGEGNSEGAINKDNSGPAESDSNKGKSEGAITKDNSGPAESGSGKGNSESTITKDKSGPAESGSGKGNSEGTITKDKSGPAEHGSDKDNLEGDTTKDNSGPAESGNGKGNSDILASNNSKENSEPSEKKTELYDAQPVSTQTEALKSEDAPNGKVVQGKDDDVVIKALKEAFHLAGCPLTSEDQLSFAEAGNSVMALAAFLTQLVEPGLATAYARSSLKTISKSSPGSQLAFRHCFILEDPADDVNKHVVSKSIASEKLDQNASELSKEDLSNEKEIISTEEKSTSMLDGSHSTEGQIPKEDTSNIRDDSQLPPSGQDSCAVNSGLPEKPDEEIPQVAEKPDEKSRPKEKPDEEMPQVPEKHDEEKSLISEKPDDEKSQVAVKPDDENAAQKHNETSNIEQTGTKSVNETQNSSLQSEQSVLTKDQVTAESEVMPPCSASGSENLKNEADNVKGTNSTKDTVVEPSSVVTDKTQPEIAGGVPTVEAVAEAGEDKMDVDKTGDPKPAETAPRDPKAKETTQKKDDDHVAKLKRAALATLSAAAVKSKLLANQEEDEIRQLATILIEKQMRKLEVKLSYFTEMESAIMRVRDQLERSRQRLFNERAQIIASRLGIPPSSSSRMLPSSYPVNRMPPGLLNSMLRPPMGSGAQRPPMSRPVMTTAPPATSTSAPPEVAAGSPTQPSATDEPSSVGTS